MQLADCRLYYDEIQRQATEKWLHETADSIVSNTLMPTTSDDTTYTLHSTLLHLGFLYMDLRNAIRWEDGPHIVRHWKFSLACFIATGCRNYAAESIHFTAKLSADLPRHLSYIATHNRTVNMVGKPGHGKTIDQVMEHYNLSVRIQNQKVFCKLFPYLMCDSTCEKGQIRGKGRFLINHMKLKGIAGST